MHLQSRRDFHDLRVPSLGLHDTLRLPNKPKHLLLKSSDAAACVLTQQPREKHRSLLSGYNQDYTQARAFQDSCFSTETNETSRRNSI